MVNSWFPGLGPLANAWKPGFYQDSRKPPGFQWDRGKCIFPPGIYQGESWKTGAATRPEFQLFSSYIPGISPGCCLVSGGKSAFSQVFSWVNTRGFPGFSWCLPGGAPGDKKPGFYLGETRYFGSGGKNLVNPRGKPGIHWFSRKTDKY